MLVALVFLSLLTFLILGVWGRNVGREGAACLGLLGLGCTAVGFWYLVWCRAGVLWVVGTDWLEVGVNWSFLFDTLSLEMALLITTITLCVILYSLKYMWHDPYIIRFLGYLVVFAFFMLVLVTAGNLVQMFMGWGVGLLG